MRGFTLLEMMVVIGILSVMAGSGMAAIVPFKENREVLSDARNMASLLKQTQVKSSAVEVPSGCDVSGVGEFEVSFYGNKVDLEARDPSGSVCKQEKEVLVFSNGARFVADGSVIFKVPFGSANPTVVSICNYSIQYDIDIGENGSVSEPRKSSC